MNKLQRKPTHRKGIKMSPAQTIHALAIARSMIAAGEPVDKIIKYTELSRKEIENLRN
jgi:hypothetical protein